jgi:predicted acylesterase/phospholipase RssA
MNWAFIYLNSLFVFSDFCLFAVDRRLLCEFRKSLFYSSAPVRASLVQNIMATDTSSPKHNRHKTWKQALLKFFIHTFIVLPLLWTRNVVARYTMRQQQRRTEKRYLDILASTEDRSTWMHTALNLDALRGIDVWRVKPPDDPYCNPQGLILEANVALDLAKSGNMPVIGDFILMMLARNSNGLTAPLLYRYYTGTKVFVEDYISAIGQLLEVFCGKRPPSEVNVALRRCQANSSTLSEATLDSVFLHTMVKEARDVPLAPMSIRQKVEILRSASQSFGRSALMLSGGASLGMYHTGVIRALFEAKLLPTIISGSSAGAIVASIICTRTDSELTEMLLGNGLALHAVHLNAFEVHENVEESVIVKINRLTKTGAFMDVRILMECLRQNCGDLTFQEAFHKSGRILNVSVANSRRGEHADKHMLLNYITAPDVVVWSAVSASCAMPGLFTAVQLIQKAADGEMAPYLPGQLWFDGSVACDLPKEELSTQFNVNYFIVSQTNPHVIPFLKKPPSPLVHKKKTGLLKRLWFAACSEWQHWLVKLYKAGLLPKSGGAEVPYLMATQNYDGDITILPIGSVWAAIPDFINLTTNPSAEHLEYVISNGQRRTWPHLNQIKNVTAIERALNDALKFMESHWRSEQTGGEVSRIDDE